MQLSISPRDRRTLLVGALSVGAIVGVGKGLPALRTWEAAQVNAAVEMRQRLALTRRDAASLQVVKDSAAARYRRLMALRTVLVRAQSAEAAAATLASIVEEVADESEVDVQSIGLRPDSVARAVRGLVRVAVQLSAESDVTGLLLFLHGVETRRTPLLVRTLTVSQPDPAAPSSNVETLRFDVRIETLATVATPAVQERPRGKS